MIDIERLAREAGMNTSMWEYGAGSIVFTMGIEGVARGSMERFAALVLEAAANAADELQAPPSCSQVEKSLWDVATTSVGDAIRALKFKK